jgi:drug/metabolite transporter (DMT)-like permease
MTAGSTALRLGALVAVTAVWGGTFVVVKDAVSVYPVAAFLGYRFVLALLIFTPFVVRGSWRSIRAGIPIGIVMGIAFVIQTIGLRLTLASDTGLITGLFVIFVPLLEWLVLRRAIGLQTGIGSVISLAGLVLLVGGLPRQLAIGDLLVGISAIGFAAQIVLLSRRSPHHDTISLTFGVVLGGAIVFFLAALTPPGGGLPFPPVRVWPALIITAVFATAIGFFIQSWAQRDLPATPTAVVLLTEPGWAALFGVVLQGNPFPPARIVGALLLFVTPLLLTLAGTRPAQRILIYAAQRAGV